jgi:hypothetical protein
MARLTVWLTVWLDGSTFDPATKSDMPRPPIHAGITTATIKATVKDRKLPNLDRDALDRIDG